MLRSIVGKAWKGSELLPPATVTMSGKYLSLEVEGGKFLNKGVVLLAPAAAPMFPWVGLPAPSSSNCSQA